MTAGGIIYDFLKQVPSGICATGTGQNNSALFTCAQGRALMGWPYTDIRQGQKTFFWWRWNRFEFMGGDGTINAYEEVSSSVIK